MRHYGKIYINIFTLIITIILFIQTNYIILKVINSKESQNLGKQIIQIDKFQISELSNQNKTIEKEATWSLSIPKINITATIEEGTTQDILINYVGHFSRNTKNRRQYRVNRQQ